MPFPLFLYRLLPFGRRSEILGIDFVRSQGYRVVATGYRTRNGEVDIIAWQGPVLVFIEVKARRSADRPEDSVGVRKRQRIIRAAKAYISKYKLQNAACRFDILAVTSIRGSKPEFRLLRDAFTMYN